MEWQHNRKGQLCSFDAFGAGAGMGAGMSESGFGAGIDPFSSGVGAGVNPADLIPPGATPTFDLGPEAGGAMGGIYSREPFDPAVVPKPAPGGFDPSTIIKALPALAGGGMQLVNMFRSSPTEKLISSGQQQMRGISKAAGTAGKTLLNQYMTGKLRPDQEAQAERDLAARLAQVNQYIASAGLGKSTAAIDLIAKARQENLAFRNVLAQQNIENSFKSLGLANNSLAQQAGINWRLNTDVANSQAQAAEAIAKMAGIFFPGNTQQVY